MQLRPMVFHEGERVHITRECYAGYEDHQVDIHCERKKLGKHIVRPAEDGKPAVTVEKILLKTWMNILNEEKDQIGWLFRQYA